MSLKNMPKIILSSRKLLFFSAAFFLMAVSFAYSQEMPENAVQTESLAAQGQIPEKTSEEALPQENALTDADPIKDDAVLNAMSAELKRHYPVLQKAEKVPIYYLGYEVDDEKSYSLVSEMGAIGNEHSFHSRQLDISARAGSHAMDNTHQIKGAYNEDAFAEYSQPLPIDDDSDALRAAIWLHTDSALKRAFEAYTKVQMNKALTAEEEDASPDFSANEPKRHYDTAEMPDFDKNHIKSLLNAVSGGMKKYPFVFAGIADFNVLVSNRYIADSEGTLIKTGRTFIRMTFFIRTRTEDGMELYRSRDYNVKDVSKLPDEQQLMADLQSAAEELDALRKAPMIEPFSGPAIMNARASGVFFHEIIGHRLEGHRQKLEDSGQTFAKKLNEKVTADFINLYDDPRIKEWEGEPLRGHYLYDDEGVAADRASLIENGVLKGFLMSRSPVRGFMKSNGHGRKASGYEFAVSRMGNTIVNASRTVKYEELRKMLVDEIKKQGKPYGLIFDDISGGYTLTGRGSGQTFKVNPLMVYKVYADGQPDELVRGVDLVGTPIASFGKIAAAADDYKVFNGDCGAETGWVPVSAIAPSILITEVEVEKSQKSQSRLPVLPPPASEKVPQETAALPLPMPAIAGQGIQENSPEPVNFGE